MDNFDLSLLLHVISLTRIYFTGVYDTMSSINVCKFNFYNFDES